MPTLRARCGFATALLVLSFIQVSHQVTVLSLRPGSPPTGFARMRFAEAPEASDVTSKFGSEVLKYANDQAAQAQQKALKFQEAGTQSLIDAAKADAAAASEAKLAEAAGANAVFKVEPGAEGGVEMKPAPGQNDPPIRIRSPGEYLDAVQTTSDYIGGHSYKSDVKALLAEVDQSENKAKGLKLRIVEKENFVDSLIKREDLLQEDLRRDKVATENLHSHIKALKARIERLKKEKQLSELEAQYHQYSAAASKVSSQAAELEDVKDALFSKMRLMHNQIAPLRESEDVNMRLSINADPSFGAQGDQQAAAALQNSFQQGMAMGVAAAEQDAAVKDAAAAASESKVPAPAGGEGAAAGGEAAK